jgi:hypothetical protein
VLVFMTNISTEIVVFNCLSVVGVIFVQSVISRTHDYKKK